MKIHRIYAMVLRHLYNFKHNYDRLSDSFYWPTIDLLLWGLTSLYFRSYLPQDSTIVISIISGILFWIIVWRGQYEVSVNLLSEMWDKNLINLFVSPLKFSEWVSSLVILGIIKSFVSFVFATLVSFVLYKVQIFFFGFYFIPFIILLLMTGWWVGFLVAGIILRFGMRAQFLAWSMVAILSPFSAIYYPLSVLPHWAQQIAYLIPTTYIFEGMRSVIYKGTLDINTIYISFFLNLLYILLALWFFKASFSKVIDRGLTSII